MNQYIFSRIIIPTLTGILLSFDLNMAFARGNLFNSYIALRSQAKSTQPSPPPDDPESTRGQGTRGSCILVASGQKQKLTIIPIAPPEKRETVSKSPTLWFYISYETGNIDEQLSSSFIVENRKTDEQFSEQRIALPQNSGLFSVSVTHALDVEETGLWYRWYFNFSDCEPDNPTDPEFLTLEGYLKRVENTAVQIENNLLKQITWYSQNDFWYDAFHKATEFTCGASVNPELSNYWRTLLTEQKQVFGLDNTSLLEIVDSSLICPK